VLKLPATLRVTMGSLPTDARLYWQVGDETLLLPSTREGNTLAARIGVLGFTANGGVLEVLQRVAFAQAAGARAQRQNTAPASSGDLVVAVANCERDIGALKTRLRNAAQINNLSMAQAIFDELGALQSGCDGVAIQQAELDACVGLSASVVQASAAPARTFEAVGQRTASLLGALANVEKTGGTCPGDVVERANALIPTVFNQFLDTLRAGIRDGSLFEDAGARDFGLLFQYEAGCQLLGLDTMCDRFSTQIYPDLLDAMRRASFDECRQTNSTLVMSQFHAIGASFDSQAKFADHARFSMADVRRDISYCTNPRVEVRVFDDALDIPTELVERRQNLQLAPALDDYRPFTIAQVPRAGSLNVSGVFRGQRCANGEALPADLVVRLSTIELARRTLVNGNYDFSAQPLDLVISRIGLSSEVDNFRVSFQLEGGRCVLPAERGAPEVVVMNLRETLFEIEVGLPSGPGPVVLTEVLPAATQNLAYQAILESNLPLGTGVWQLSAGNLPLGLTLNSNSGTISGTPSATGNFTFTVQVSAGALSSLRVLVIDVSPSAALSVQFATGQVRIQEFQSDPIDVTCNVTLRMERIGERISITRFGSLSACVGSFSTIGRPLRLVVQTPEMRLLGDGTFSETSPIGLILGTDWVRYRGSLLNGNLSLEKVFYRGDIGVIEQMFELSIFSGRVGATPP
jgi:hypothetical protein